MQDYVINTIEVYQNWKKTGRKYTDMGTTSQLITL